MRISGRTFLRAAALAFAAFSLCACVETASDLNASRQKPQVQAPGIPVALVSLDGAPEGITSRLNLALQAEAKVREIVLVSDKDQPRFKLKGYLSAYTVEGGTAIGWVWDMYDASLHRAQRIDGAQMVKRSDSDPWNAIDDATLKFAASSSMNDLAFFLANAKLAPVSPGKAAPPTRTPSSPASPVAGPAIAAKGSTSPFTSPKLGASVLSFDLSQ